MKDSAAVSDTRSKLFDLQGSLERFDDDLEVLAEVAFIFCEHADSMLEEIRTAVDQRAPRELRRAAHTLKGSLGTFGAQEGVEAAKALEKHAELGDLSGAPSLYGRVENVTLRLRKELDRFLGSSPGA